MEIRYVPADEHNTTTSRCYQGCPRCTSIALDETDDQVKSFDDNHLRRLSRRTRRPLAWNDEDNSGLSSSKNNISSHQEKRWTTLRHSYLQAAVLTNANLWLFAPQGLSKYSHLADGSLDLVLIEHTTRKEFLRYVKRNGNSKDQYQFPFTNLIKVKEIEIELKFPNDNLTSGILNTDNQSDLSEPDESLDVEQQRDEPCPLSVSVSTDNRHHHHRHRHFLTEQTQRYSDSMDASLHYLKNQTPLTKTTTNELDSQQVSPRSPNIPFRRKNIFQSLRIKKEKIPLPRAPSAGSNELPSGKQTRKNQRSTGGSYRSARSFLNLFTSGNSSLNEKQDSSSATTKDSERRNLSLTNRSSSLGSRKTSTLFTKNQYRNQKQPCMWNLDFTPYNSPLIRIKCFHRFLPVFGVGLSPDTEIKEVNYSCFGRIG